MTRNPQDEGPDGRAAKMTISADDRPKEALRRGWTTGACSAAAAKAAYIALLTNRFPDPVQITLPKGERPSFDLVDAVVQGGRATVSVVKNAGDDPDVTHGALIEVSVSRGDPGTGVIFIAGDGVGVVTLPGLPLSVGEPAINPGPRKLISTLVADIARDHGDSGDIEVTISIPGGELIAKQTANGRLGIVGGLSILGTTGVVVPFSCAAWIASIHRGIDVARAAGFDHVAASTGSTSERAVKAFYDLPELGADRDGRLCRRHVQISAPASHSQGDPRRRLRQGQQAGGGTSQSALQAVERRPRGFGRHARGSRGGRRAARSGKAGQDRQPGAGAGPTCRSATGRRCGGAGTVRGPRSRGWQDCGRDADFRSRRRARRTSCRLVAFGGHALKTLLILGGTSEAAALAGALCSNESLHVITSLAGRTKRPRKLPGEVRTGGFGGVSGLSTFLRERAIDAVIDATHPFAVQMSQHAADACRGLAVPRLYLARPPWERHSDDLWFEVADTSVAAIMLPGLGTRVFLTSGQHDLDAFQDLDDHWFLIRTVEPVHGTAPKQLLCLQERGPFTEADEIALLKTHRIDVLVTKASGGSATYGKIAAARKLGLPVVMIKRPKAQNGPTVTTVDDAVAWLQRQVTG